MPQSFLRRGGVRAILSLVLAAALGASLVATIALTLLDLQWLAFLGGVLFAAVLALASQASKAEWAVRRRSRQLERTRELLARETAQVRSLTGAMRISEGKLRLMGDALPILILYADREERCHFHNRALEEKTGLTADRIEGHPLREVLDTPVYLSVVPHMAAALSARTVEFTLAWDNSRADALYSARMVPCRGEDVQPHGYYLLLTPLDAPLRRGPSTIAQDATALEPGPPAAAVEVVSAVPAEGGQALYLRSITDDLMGWDNPQAKLRRALDENQFLLFAQKILPLKSGLPDPACFEILLRLREEEDNLLPPGGFIAVAESCGMMQDLDRWVVRNLLEYRTRRMREDPRWRAPLHCINLAQADFEVDFARFVRSELQAQALPGRCLCFEIGEPDVVNCHEKVQSLMAALKPAGCRFTIDAFGATKVSFTYLKGLQIDFIKIDGAIIQNILRDSTEFAKVRAIATTCRKIGVRTIAEFVETKETLDKLREAEVDYVQGFGIARPGPMDATG